MGVGVGGIGVEVEVGTVVDVDDGTVVGVAVGEEVSVAVGMGVLVTVAVGDAVEDGDDVGVGDGAPPTLTSTMLTFMTIMAGPLENSSMWLAPFTRSLSGTS